MWLTIWIKLLKNQKVNFCRSCQDCLARGHLISISKKCHLGAHWDALATQINLPQVHQEAKSSVVTSPIWAIARSHRLFCCCSGDWSIQLVPLVANICTLAIHHLVTHLYLSLDPVSTTFSMPQELVHNQFNILINAVTQQLWVCARTVCLRCFSSRDKHVALKHTLSITWLTNNSLSTLFVCEHCANNSEVYPMALNLLALTMSGTLNLFIEPQLTCWI